jgi:hypothetical protein
MIIRFDRNQKFMERVQFPAVNPFSDNRGFATVTPQFVHEMRVRESNVSRQD